MEIIKHIDCATASFAATLPDRRGYQVVVAKRAWEIGPEGQLVPRKEQELLSFGDLCEGPEERASLVWPSDVVPYKPNCDIILLANARAPGNRPARSWTCGLRIAGQHVLDQHWRVTGPRQWLPEWLAGAPKSSSPRRTGFLRWRLGEPEPATTTVLCYENAWGGQQISGDEVIACEGNPVGCGWIDAELTDHSTPQPAPRIEAPDQPITDPYQAHTPACPAPLLPSWLPRRPLGGTFDADWQEKQSPWWPEDYSFAYHNAAPAALQWPGFLAGDEVIRFENLVSGAPEFQLKLPGLCLIAEFPGTAIRMAADTLLLDIRDDDPERWIIAMTWRVIVPPGRFDSVTIDEAAPNDRLSRIAYPPFAPEQVATSIQPEAADG